MNAVVLSSSNLFVYCFFGLLATENHRKMEFCLYSCDWIGIDIEYQKYLILMIANIQKPIRYHGFNVFVLDLKTFCSVSKSFAHNNERNTKIPKNQNNSFFVFQFLNTVMTYYMMFKTLTE